MKGERDRRQSEDPEKLQVMAGCLNLLQRSWHSGQNQNVNKELQGENK